VEGWERGAVAASYDPTFLYRKGESLLQHVGSSRNTPFYTVCACLNIKHKLQTCNLVTWRTIIFDLEKQILSNTLCCKSKDHTDVFMFISANCKGLIYTVNNQK